MKVQFNYQNILSFVSVKDVQAQKAKALKCRDYLINKDGEGNDFVGWVDYPIIHPMDEYERIKKAAEKIQQDSDCLIVIGIGGSYLGAKACIEALRSYFPLKKQVEIIFAGNTLSSTYVAEIKEYLKDKSFSINIISKSGTTTEPAVSFRIFQKLLEEKYGKAEAAKRIYATTDAKKGALRTQSVAEGYETFVVPDDIGGRYSWFTAVGLLPIAAAGIDIDAMMKGALDARNDAMTEDFENNACLQYAACRNLLMNKGKNIEILVNYEPKMSYISEWWKQLYGESEGKDGKGIFPASLVYSTDLHSMGQYVQEGQRLMFETVLNIENPEKNIIMSEVKENLDGLNFLKGKSLDYVNKMAMQGTVLAHVDGGVPNMMLSIEKIDAYHIGYLLYFFMFSCGVCCYMTGVNPFNQPGVESYKKNMFALLEKPGYEEMTAEIKKRIK